MALPSCCPFGFPFGAPFRTECLTEYKLVPLLRSVLLLYGSFGLFSLPVPPDIFRNFRLHFLLVFNSTFKWTSGVFFRLTEQSDHLLLSNLWLFRCANPRVWMIRFLTQLRIFPLLHIFRVTFYRLPDDIKIQHKIPWMQLFWPFCINHVSTGVINNCS